MSVWLQELFFRTHIKESLCSRGHRLRRVSGFWKAWVWFWGSVHCGNAHFNYWYLPHDVEPMTWGRTLKDLFYR